MKPKSKLRSFLAIANSSLLAISYTHAGDGTWNVSTAAATHNWTDSAMWASGTIADGADFTASFTGVDIAGAKVVSLNGVDRTIGNITFTDLTTSSNDLTISGANILTLDRSSGISTIDVTQSGRSLIISSVVAGSDGLQKNGAGILSLSNAGNTFTGGITLNGGTLKITTVSTVGSHNNNNFSVISTSILDYSATTTVTTTTSDISLSNGAMLDFRGNTRTFTTSGAVTGAGGIILGQAGQGATILNFNSTGNNFTGAIEYRVTPNAGQNGTLSVNSIGDATSLGSGDIRFGLSGTGTNVHVFNFGGSAGAPSGPLTFDKRRFELAGTHALSQINNNSAENFTVNTDLVVSANSGMLLTLGGTGAGISTYAGDIIDNPAGTTGATATAAAYAIGASTITLGSVSGFTTGATITGTGIPVGTTVTFIDPLLKRVTLSAVTTVAGVVGQQINIAGVTSNVSLTKAGIGTWVLSGTNTHSGGTTVANNGGTLRITTPAALSTGSVLINTQGAATTNTGTLELALTGTNTIANNFATASANALNNTAPGTAHILNTSGTNTISGNITTYAGGGNGTNVVSNGGFLTLSGNYSSTVGSARTLSLGGTANGEVSGIIANDAGGVFASSVTKVGSGTWTLSGGSNTYSGTTTVASSGGTLRITNAAALGTSAVTVNTTGTNTGTLELALTGTNNITNTFNAFNTANSLTNASPGNAQIVNTSGTNTIISSLTTVGAAGTGLNVVSNGGLLTLSGGITNNASTVGSLNLGGTGNGAVSGAVTDTTVGMSVTKSGAGTWTLSSAASNYTGATTVNGGTLLVNGNVSTSVLTTVETGATLGGSGIVGALTVLAGGAIAPGNSSPDVLDVNGAYTQAGIYQAEITANTPGNGTTGYDQNNVTGGVDITGGSLSTLFSGTGYAANDLLFILLNDGADTITGTYTGLAQGAVVGTHDGFDWQISYTADSFGNTFTGGGGNDIALMAVAIPEPATALLGALGLLALLRRRR